MEELQKLREKIDKLDSQLLEVLAQRFQVTEQIGKIKVANKFPLVDPTREAAQAARIATLARTKGVDPKLAQAIQRLIIDNVVVRHQAIAKEFGDE